jgi:soluble lytic murein transglycosylase
MTRTGIYILFLLFFWGIVSCAAQQTQPDFYQGLLRRNGLPDTQSAGEARAEAAALFEKALASPNVYIRQAAARELLTLFYEGNDFSKPAPEKARREAAGSWAAAFKALDAEGPAAREQVLAFILGSGNGGVFPDEAAFYTLRECLKRDANAFGPAEAAAIEGHIAVSRSRFAEALNAFRRVIDEDPHMLFRYPGLLNDLGRSFQYAAIGIDGVELFLRWEQDFAEGQSPEIRRYGDIPGIRFRLLFFAARIARQRGLLDQGIALFIRALAFAPDPDQRDACIWYILDSALNYGPAAAIRHLSVFVSQWHDDAYFFDVLDKLSRELTLRRQWKELISVFILIRNRPDRASTAKYAYIIGRALAEGYLPPEETLLAASALAGADLGGEAGPALSSGGEALSAAYLRIAYDAGNASLYYRSKSAATLDKPFLKLPENRPAKTGGGQSAAMEFLLGFFNNAAAAFAPGYIRALETELSAGELRLLAEALGKAELYAESMRLVSVYMEREGYETDRRDLELWYPQPFKELVEQYAAETGIAPELLFGLIRTESAFQSDIVSRAGAVGLTQLMPATAEEMAARIHRQGGPEYTPPEQSGPNLRDPATNIHIGAIYLGYLQERMEDTLLALLAYNGGINRIRRWRTADSRATPGGLPIDLFLETIEYPETREYGRRVLAAAAMYEQLYYGVN